MSQPEELGNCDPRSLRVEMRFKNARLWQAIQDRCLGAARLIVKCRGKPPVIKVASELSGVPRSVIEEALRLQWQPTYSMKAKAVARRGTWKPHAVMLAEMLDMQVADLFPLELYRNVFPSMAAAHVEPVQFLSLASPEAKLLAAPADGKIEALALAEAINALTSAVLTDRQKQIIEARFGLNGCEEKTLEALGKEQNVTKDRIRQIEAQALRALRGPRAKRYHLQEWT